MGLLSQFILQEALQVSHADRYLSYVERFHLEVFLDLKKELEKQWLPICSKLNNRFKIHEQDRQEQTLQNPKACLEIELVSKTEKLTSSRSHTPLEISPSVKIPLFFKKEERELVLEELIDAAHITFLNTTDKWKSIFNYEKKGQLVPWFNILLEKDEIRLQLALSHGSSHSYRTLYSVRTEYGKIGSKIKDYNRIYLTSAI